MSESGLPPGQRYVRGFIVYAALGLPEVDLQRYRLRITGLVERELEYTYEKLMNNLPKINYRSDFHCVTKWSVKDVVWEGVPIKWFAEQAGVKADASWVNFRCLDGYVAPVPLEDALSERAIVALKINGGPIKLENGFPCRAFIPHLYGWKSAKHLSEIEFTDRYGDGFWEVYGYHERGNVWLEERFKGGFGRHVRRSPVVERKV
ncbi:MAG: sulfite oxidase-like oxidoreductase [Nitrososphaerota archaeon]|nr:sulfite oxidase-like oxidoreductase [Candidatus Calditenuaceae archaeon]MDW8072793.1 sulfite oxidase-like oxidoreductase [Nitrososphaerota archaeon]